MKRYICERSVYVLSLMVVMTVIAFELFSTPIVDDGLRKEQQYEEIIQETFYYNFNIFLNYIAKYIHEKAPFLELVPYATPTTDSRLSTWYLPPHQVVVEWIFYGILFSWTFASGPPRRPANFLKQKPLNYQDIFAILAVTGCTFIAVLYYKFRAWIQLGEWFALVYLLQPCHVLILGYTILLSMLLRTQVTSPGTTTLMSILFDLQWCTIVAIALPDTEALLDRNFFGELYLFWFEHVLLVVLPYTCMALFFSDSTPSVSWQTSVRRSWYSATVFGVHNMHIMTPVSLIGGIQVNYNTHLPQYAMGWFGRWYKTIILLIAFSVICLFNTLVEPAWKYIIKSAKSKKRKRS